MVTLCVAGSKDGGSTEVSANELASRVFASRSASTSSASAVSRSMSANGPEPSTASRPSTSKRLNEMSLRLDL
jgi:hypothetical protein